MRIRARPNQPVASTPSGTAPFAPGTGEAIRGASCSSAISAWRSTAPPCAREILAGCTTFLTMAYIIFVNPQILGEAGMDKGAVFVATCLASALGTRDHGALCELPAGAGAGHGAQRLLHLRRRQGHALFLAGGAGGGVHLGRAVPDPQRHQGARMGRRTRSRNPRSWRSRRASACSWPSSRSRAPASSRRRRRPW